MTLPGDEEVVTGTEMQYVVIRVAVANTGETPTTTCLRLLLGSAVDSQNVNYAPFTAPVSRWQQTSLKLEPRGKGLLLDGRPFLVYQASGPATATLESVLQGSRGANEPLIELHYALRFDLSLAAKETRTVDLVVAGNSKLPLPGELKRMAALRFDRAWLGPKPIGIARSVPG